MKKFSKFLFLGMTLMLTGCTVTNTPFVPVAVPNATSMKPAFEVKRDLRAERKALAELQKVKVPDYTIMPDDVLSIIIPGREDLTRQGAIVMADGSVSVSPVGRIKVSGLTFDQASQKISQSYKKILLDCPIILEPVKVRQATVVITGAIGKGGGAVPIVAGRTRLRDVVAQSGGLQVSDKQESLADLNSAVIIRNSKILPVDFTKLIKDNDPLQNIPLLDGDYIDVPSMSNTRITVLGEVGGPDAIIYQPGMTLLELLARAGGLKETNSRHIKVIRGGLVNPTVYNINIRDMQRGRIRDFPVYPKDIVYVPRDPVSDWNVIIKQITPTIQFINGLAGPFGNPSAFLYK